jgi:hypothetical protein
MTVLTATAGQLAEKNKNRLVVDGADNLGPLMAEASVERGWPA